MALKASSRTTKGVKVQLWGFGILCVLIILLGYLCLFVGVLAAYPIVLIASALVYRHLMVQTPELAELGIDNRPRQAPQQFVQSGQTVYQQYPQDGGRGPGNI